MKAKQLGYTGTELVMVIFGIAGLVAVGGWVANIVKLIGMDFGTVTGLLVARSIGVFMAPLGAVLGFF